MLFRLQLDENDNQEHQKGSNDSKNGLMTRKPAHQRVDYIYNY